jgi:hypothetical protein
VYRRRRERKTRAKSDFLEITDDYNDATSDSKTAPALEFSQSVKYRKRNETIWNDLSASRNALAASLQTLYEETFVLKDKEDSGVLGRANPIIDRFNEALQEARGLYQEKKDSLAKVKTVGKAPTHFGISQVHEARGKVQEVYLEIAKLGTILGISLEKPHSGRAPLVQLSITQQVSQFVSFDYDQLIQTIEQQQVEQKTRREAEEAVKQFRDELSKPQPEPSKLKSHLATVMKVGKEFVVPLLMKLIENWDKIFPRTSN